MSKKMSMSKASKAMYDGLAYRGKKRMEFLTVTVRPELKIFINEKFDLLIDRLSRYMNKWGKKTEVSYLRVTVYRKKTSHIHALVIKPWIFSNELIKMWEDITGIEEEGSIRCKTVRKDKTNRKDMRTLVTYMLKQEEEHKEDVLEVEYVHSNNWKMVGIEDLDQEMLEF